MLVPTLCPKVGEWPGTVPGQVTKNLTTSSSLWLQVRVPYMPEPWPKNPQRLSVAPRGPFQFEPLALALGRDPTRRRERTMESPRVPLLAGAQGGGSQGKGPVVTWVQAGTCDAGLLGRRRQAKARPAEKYRYYPASRAPPQQNPILLPSSPHPRPGRQAGGHPLLATGWAASGQGSSLAAAAAATPGIGAGGGAHAVVAGGSGGVVGGLAGAWRCPGC